MIWVAEHVIGAEHVMLAIIYRSCMGLGSALCKSWWRGLFIKKGIKEVFHGSC